MSEMEDEWVCGEAYDHDIYVVHDDHECIQWVCRNCGAEGWEDK